MQAIILAAGMGTRLGELTLDKAKCMVEVNGVSLIGRMLRQIDGRGLERIVLVVGYKARELISHVSALDIRTPLVYVRNPIYDRTNNIYSLALAKEYLCGDDTLLFESDLIFEADVIDLLLNDRRGTLALVAKYESWMDGTCVKLDGGGRIGAFVPKKEFRFEECGGYYKTVNIYKFSKDFSRKFYVPFLEAYSSAHGNNEYYERVLGVVAALDSSPLRAKVLEGLRWYEIDDVQDLDIAASLFASDGDRLSLLRGRGGGYWRYPGLLDFSDPGNPFFPPQRLKDEMKASFETILTRRSSDLRICGLPAAKDFCLQRENTVVGNGAAALGRALVRLTGGSVGLFSPVFERGTDLCPGGLCAAYVPKDGGFSCRAQELITFFEDKNISLLLLSEPDDFTGTLFPGKELLTLLNWTRERKIRLLLDESAADFADEDSSLLKQELLNANPQLFVLKNIARAHGVQGLRLGLLASGDVRTLAAVREDVSAERLDAFAEFYLQIFGKYRNAYVCGLERFRAERARFVRELRGLRTLRVFPCQANFVMAELVGRETAEELCGRLLLRHRMLLEAPGAGYLRIAVRNEADNDRLLAALRAETKPAGRRRV